LTFVLDASVAIAWCFVDEQTPAVMALLDQVTETGAIAPVLWPIEVTNVLAVSLRRKRIDATEFGDLAAFLRMVPVALDAETTARVWTDAATLANRFGISVYDATYLELARRRGLPLATLDRPLRVAAAALGIETLGLAPG
jgi:predicted nucleic acid-binding protein